MTSKSDPQDDPKLQDRRIRKTRNAIRAALKTLLQRGSIEQITIKDIAREADIGYTTFFRHFGTKEAAIADFADTAAAELLDATLPLLSTSDGLTSTLALCHHVAANRHVWEALLTGGAADYVRSSLAAHTTERATLWPPMQDWLPADKGTILATGMVVETLTWWLAHAPELSPEQVAQIMNHTFISALLGAR
ncbi:TetR/AcrR family transcriptional regulator [Novosphingobium sp. JCM 18896]|uniref:TetR/AcrR family transcriptional regulator n=1 Tax=Novosphingobium sp. JCM 18896 TaxID=2989731 RepID=UPI002222DACC|nr:TetR/AcrR family transcriptional regulator [Novosphingobium sp. JCM 18896]MCW1430767.1 TetR/AcrR family transcriptional regulator [Novosphingobium sp. JCM 18896]